MNNTQQFEQKITIAGKQARYYDFSSLTGDTPSNGRGLEKPAAHFYGGNGFVAGVYEPLLTLLGEQFDVSSLAMRGYWYDLPTDKVMTREQDADMLIEFLEKTQTTPVVGIGHSQGATATAMAAAKRPDLFAAIYLIDPVTFTKSQKLLYGNLPKRLLMTQQPFKSTQTKQTDWASADEYYQSLRKQRAFKRISDDNLYTYAKNSLVAKPNGGFTLLFQPQYELASYFGTPYLTPALKKLNKIKEPYHLILAKPSVYISNKVRDSWKDIVPHERITTLPDYGHLIPMETPQQCAELIFKHEQAR